MKKNQYEPLKIAAMDQEDLQVFASFLQDALVPISGMTYDENQGHFYLVVNRFCWECHTEASDGEEVHQRVSCGVHINHVENVKQKGFDPNHEDGFMNLLTVHNQKNGCVSLVFSGGGEVELKVSKLKCLLKDMDEPYPTKNRPSHPIED